MIRRIIAFGLLVVLIGTVFPVFNLIPIGNVSAELNPPHDDGLGMDSVSGDNVHTTDGDWVINSGDVVAHADKTILVNGDLIIEENAQLTLTGVTLQMNCGFDGQYGIYVQAGTTFSGGIFVVEESLINPSVITSYTEDGAHRFRFIVEGSAFVLQNAFLDMTNSELRECGWDDSEADFKDSGLWLGSSNNVIDGNYIHDCFNGVTIYGMNSASNLIQNNNISYCEGNGTYVKYSSNIIINNNEYYENIQGMNVNNSVNLIVTNNTIDMCYIFGAYFGAVDGIEFEYNEIINLQGYNNWVFAAVVFNDFCDNINANYNTIKNCPFMGIMAFDYIGNVVITNNNIDNLYNSGIITIANGDSAYIYKNTIGTNTSSSSLNDAVGIWGFDIRNNLEIINNSIYNMPSDWYSNTGAGISLWGIQGGTIKGNILNNNELSGLYIIDSGNLSIEENIIENNGYWGIQFTDPMSPSTNIGVVNTTVINNQVNNNEFGILSIVGSDQIITNNTLDSNADTGIYVGVDGTYVAYNIITNNGEGDDEYEGGVAIVGDPTINPIVSDVVLYQNSFIDNIGFLTYPIDGIYLQDADNILIEECTLDNNEIGIHAYDSVTNVLVVNSTITMGFASDYNIQLETDSDLTTLNTTFDNSSTDIDPTSELTCKWYLNVKVLQGPSGVNGANIFINDSKGAYDPLTGQPFVTSNWGGEDGWARWIPVTEYKDSNNIKDYHTPHWVNASYGASDGLARPKVWQSQDIFINLNGKVQVVDLDAPPFFVNRTETIKFYANGTDIEDYETDFLVEFEYRDPNDISWNTSFLGGALYFDTNANPNDDIGFWYISFTPGSGAITGWYDIRVRFKDTYGSYSDWFELPDSVLVGNSPPYVENMYNETFSAGAPVGAVFRGDYAWIYADGEDLDDGDDQNFLNAEFQYRRPGEPSFGTHSLYWNPNTPEKSNGNWRQKFQPPSTLDTPTGLYEFRARFQDSDGTWGQWAYMENLTVLNYPAWLVGFSKQNPFVYRGNSVRIYADVDDREDNEYPDLDGQVKFYYKHSVSGITWEDAWLFDNGNWDGISYYADFTPPYTAELGMYQFKIEITDHDSPGVNSTTVEEIPPDLIEVRNNLPIILNIAPSAYLVNAGGGVVYLHINATDIEDAEDLLVPIVEHRFNETSPGTWMTDYIFSASYEPTGWLRVKFQPDAVAPLGRYDFRVKIIDLDNGESTAPTWIEIYQAVEVISSGPVVYDIKAHANEIYRTEDIFLTINCSDDSDFEHEMIPYIQYKTPSGSWTDFAGVFTYVDTNSNLNDDIGFWTVTFPTDVNSEIGDYRFRTKVENTTGGSTNWLEMANSVLVKNNIPQSIDIQIEKSSIERGQAAYIFVDGSDIENSEAELVPYIQYKYQSGSWNDSYLSDLIYDPGNGRWQITFTTDINTQIGNYEFRVYFEDLDNSTSSILIAGNTLRVDRAVPVPLDLNVPPEGEILIKYYITANATDFDTHEENLTALFQYRPPGGGWTDDGDLGSYFDPQPEYITGYWRIGFFAPDDAPTGLYSFRVCFSADNDTSFWLERIDSFLLFGNEILAMDLSIPSTGYRTNTYYLYANVSNPQGNEEDLIAEFEYKEPGGDWISQSSTDSYLDPSATFVSGIWQIGFSPPSDAMLGVYSFRLRFSNSTNSSLWLTKDNSFTLLNNPPEVIDLKSPASGYRMETILITANGFDLETSEKNLIPTFQHKGPKGNWIGFGNPQSYFVSPAEYIDGAWSIEFFTDSKADLGNYSLRVKFSDGIDETDWFEITDSLTLLNRAPSADNLSVPASCFRLNSVFIYANATDLDGSENLLNPEFEYKYQGSSTWVSYGSSGSYFSTVPKFQDGYWRIEFSPPKDADVGLYSFRVSFSDGMDSSSTMEEMDSLDVKNNLPDVLISSPVFRNQTSSLITFVAQAADMEDSELTYDWDFGDQRAHSNEESPSHNYTESGEYTVTLIIYDSNGASASDSVTIFIPEKFQPEEPEPEEKPQEFDMMWILTIIPILIAAIVIVLILLLRKKKQEDEPPKEPKQPMQSGPSPGQAVSETKIFQPKEEPEELPVPPPPPLPPPPPPYVP